MIEKISDEGEKLSLDKINELEQELGAKLPDDYIEFLIKYNGGVPIPNEFHIAAHPEGSGMVQVFFGVDREIESSCLSWNYHQYGDRISKNYLPIGCTDTNDLICMSLSPETRGEIVFWDASRDHEGDAETVYPIADSFSRFFETLTHI